jgi:hypothetical protein
MSFPGLIPSLPSELAPDGLLGDSDKIDVTNLVSENGQAIHFLHPPNTAAPPQRDFIFQPSRVKKVMQSIDTVGKVGIEASSAMSKAVEGFFKVKII